MPKPIDDQLEKRVAALIGDALLTPAEVEAATRLHGATIRKRIRAGTFPAPTFLSPRRRVWPASTIRDWIASQHPVASPAGEQRAEA